MRVLVDGLAFGEGPRWHEGRLWYSDMHSHVVQAVDLDGVVETICEVPACPSGLGWLPDGRLLVVSMTDRRVLRLEPSGELVVHADLGSLASFHCNDMVVDPDGRAYVGSFGFDLHGGAELSPGELIVVEPDGSARVADRLAFPNGMAITPDGATLIVAESFGDCLTAFDRSAEGSRSNRRVWAPLGGGAPDGICLDAEGAVWWADPSSSKVTRTAEGGEQLDQVHADRGCFACMLGGPDRTTLFVLTSAASDPRSCARERSARIVTTECTVPGVGSP